MIWFKKLAQFYSTNNEFDRSSPSKLMFFISPHVSITTHSSNIQLLGLVFILHLVSEFLKNFIYFSDLFHHKPNNIFPNKLPGISKPLLTMLLYVDSYLMIHEIKFFLSDIHSHSRINFTH